MTPLQLVQSSTSAMVRLTVLVPLRDNEHRPFPPEYFLAFQQFLMRRAVGLQEYGLVFGRWADAAGDVLHDDCTPFVVTCDSVVAARLQSDLDLLIRTLFEQQRAYVEAVDVRVTSLDAEAS